METRSGKNIVIIFGATDTGKRIYEEIKDENQVAAFVDEDSSKICSLIIYILGF